jgi:hypothetical protein
MDRDGHGPAAGAILDPHGRGDQPQAVLAPAESIPAWKKRRRVAALFICETKRVTPPLETRSACFARRLARCGPAFAYDDGF